MKEVIFKSEIPISTNNERIFDRTFVIEQWFRRIVSSAIKLQYGSNWMDFFDNKDVKAFNREKSRIDRKPMLEYDGSNIIWFTSMTELAAFMKDDKIRYIIENLTGSDAEMLADKLLSIKETRNTMAHYRTITNLMLEQFEMEREALETAIEKFKCNFIYKKQNIILSCDKINIPLLNYFNQIESQQRDMQVFISEGAGFIKMVHLPCSEGFWEYTMDYEQIMNKTIVPYLDIEKLIKSFEDFVDDIIGIFINKTGDEFSIVISNRDIEQYFEKYKILVDRFYETNRNIYTYKPFELQDSKFVCNPIIWFYENTNPFKEG